MQYYVLAFTEKNHRPDVEHLLAPYGDGKEWDWYSIGGRYTGRLDGYDPDKDPNLVVTCNQCDGTGIRPGGKEEFGQNWFERCNGCNGCQGKGTHVSWPTEWPERPGDVQPVSAVEWNDDRAPFAFVTGDGWVARELWDGNEWGPNPESARLFAEALRGYSNGYVTVVDCHN